MQQPSPRPEYRTTGQAAENLAGKRISASRPGLRDLLRLALRRQPPLRRQSIDDFRQVAAERGQKIARRHACLIAQRLNRVLAERIRKLVRGDRLVRAGADP